MNHHHNGIPLVTPIEMPQGETTQYVDCPWCHQRVLLTASRHGTSMQMLTGLACCLICVCLACVPCIAGWFEETEYNCSACKRLVAKKDDNGMIDEQYLEERRAKYKKFGSWSVEEWYPFGVDKRDQGRASPQVVDIQRFQP